MKSSSSPDSFSSRPLRAKSVGAVLRSVALRRLWQRRRRAQFDEGNWGDWGDWGDFWNGEGEDKIGDFWDGNDLEMGDFWGDLLGGDGNGNGFDLCSLIEMDIDNVLPGQEDDPGDNFDLSCSTDEDGMMTITMIIDGDVEGLDADFGARDVEIEMRIPPLGDVLGDLLGFGDGGEGSNLEDGAAAEGMSFNMCFTYADDVAEEQLQGLRFCMGLDMNSLSGALDSGTNLLSSCDATLGGNNCNCRICDESLGIELSCNGGDLSMQCTDFPGLGSGLGPGGGGIDIGPMAAVEPRNMMVPRLVSSREDSNNVTGDTEQCRGLKTWCETMGRCISPLKECLDENALKLKRRRRRRRRKRGMFDKRQRDGSSQVIDKGI
uniref:Uncharacterized protein n=1 Tax=Pseudictyota dubia TaxID=2749911 RepID=A0A7R9YZZ7_9STRA